MNSVIVRVPGTTANLGSGFDTLGLAVALHNRVAVTRRDGKGATVTSPIPEEARAGATAMFEAAAAACEPGEDLEDIRVLRPVGPGDGHALRCAREGDTIRLEDSRGPALEARAVRRPS